VKRAWRPFAVFHKIVNPAIVLDIRYIDFDTTDIDAMDFIDP
jgi:hypothetical protein